MADAPNFARTKASEAPKPTGADSRAGDANVQVKDTQEKANARLQNAAQEVQRSDRGTPKTDAATPKSDAHLPGVSLIDSQKKQDATGLSPEERVKSHITESQDSKTGTLYRYDSQGRITDVAGASGQVLHFVYGDNSNQPSSLSVYDRQGKLLSVNTGELKVDQKTGDTVVSAKPDQPSSKDAKLENHYLPDGSLVVSHYDVSGRKREQDIVAPTANGNQILGRMVYSYRDAHGKPTEDVTKIDNKKPVTCSLVDAGGNISDKLEYANAKQAQMHAASVREHITYVNKQQEQTEKHELYGGAGGDKAKPVQTVERTFDKKTGEVTIHTSQANGVEQTVKLDKHGKAIEFSRQEGGAKAEFVLKDGHVADVVAHDAAGNKIEDPDIKNNLMNIAELSIAQAKQEKPEAKLPVPRDHNQDKVQEFPKAIADHLAKKDVPGLNGVLKSPDGKERLAIVGGQMFSTDGKAVGKLGDDGNVALANHKGIEAANAFREGWQFEGSDHGKYRAFETSPNMVSGRLFIPDEKTHEPVEYEVKMGMVINKKTGEQMGQIRAPSENEQQGTMDGGCLIVGKPPHPIPLANFKNAVFDLQPMGQTGYSGRRLQGICRGPEEVQADGTKRPGSSGGIFDVRAAMDDQDKRAASTVPKLNNSLDGALGFNLGDRVTGKEAMNKDEAALAASRKEMLARCLQNGRVTDEGVQALAWITQDTKRENLGPHDALIDQKRALDSAQHVLEPLPRDLSTINGTVQLPAGKNGKPEVVAINHGKIVTKGGTFALCQDQASGQLSLKEQKTGKLTHIQDLPAGTVWHMQYNEKYGHPVRADWVSMGKDGIASVGALKLQAQAELNYAKSVYQQSHSSKNEMALAETANKVRQLNGGLDRIAQGHASAKDLSLLVGNVRDHVRPTDNKSASDSANQPAKLELPTLATDHDTQSVNGQMRIGNEVYHINHGNLYQVHFKDGKSTTDSKPCGVLRPGYVVDVSGRQPLHLANTDRVVMKITVGAEREPHWIIGTGAERDTDSVGQVKGGLVDVKELNNQTQESISQAHKKNQEYFNERPYITGSLDNWLSGDREKALTEYEQSCTTMQGQMSLALAKLQDSTAHLDKDGHVVSNKNGDDVFNVDKVPTTKLDRCIGQTQLLMHYIGVAGQDEIDLAEQGKQSQKMTANAAVTTAIAAATAGTGLAFGAAVKAGQIGLGMAFAGELATGSATGAVMSATFRASNSANVGENLGSGAFEGIAMSAGSALARPFASVAATQAAALSKAEAGLALTTAEKVLVSRTGNIALKTAATVMPAVASTAGFTAAGDIRDHTHTDLRQVGLGTTFMIIAQGVGHMGGLAARETIGVAEDGIAGKTINNVPNMYTYSSLDSMGQIWEQKRQDMEKKYGCDVNDEFMRAHMTAADWSEYAGKVNQAGLTGALMAPLMTAAVHPMERAVQGSVIEAKPAPVAPESGTAGGGIIEAPLPTGDAHGPGGAGDEVPPTIVPKDNNPGSSLNQDKPASKRTPNDVLKNLFNDDPLAGKKDAPAVSTEKKETGAAEGKGLGSLLKQANEAQRKNQELRNLFSDDAKVDNKDSAKGSSAKNEAGPAEAKGLGSLLRKANESQESGTEGKKENAIEQKNLQALRDSGVVLEFGKDKYNNQIITKVETADSVWTTNDGNLWKVKDKSSGSADTVRGQLEVTKDGALKFSDDKGVNLEYPDGRKEITSSELPQALRRYDSNGVLSYLRDGAGVERTITYDQKGVLERIQSSNGEVFEFNPSSHMYKHIKDGKTENVSFGGFNEDGSFSYRDKDNNLFTRKLDDSLEKTSGSPPRTSLEEVNAKVEKEKLTHVMESNVKDPQLRELFNKYSQDYEARVQRLGSDPQEVGKTYHYLSELMSGDEKFLPSSEKAKIAEQVLKNAADPWDVNQGAYKTCQVTAMTVKMYATCPSEAARIITDVALRGSFTAADGTPIVIRKEDIIGDSNSQRERTKRVEAFNKQKEGSGKKGNVVERSHADQLLQLAAVNAHWQRQTVGPDGKACAQGDVRYEIHLSGEKGDAAERIRNATTGDFLQEKGGQRFDGPKVSTEHLEDIYYQMTGRHEDFVIANASLGRFQGAEANKTFSTESEFIRMLQSRNISETNPVVTEVSCNVRPFYEDSGRGASGGAGGQHELSITKVYRDPKDGEWYANIDNQWGPQGQHGAGPGDYGTAVKLHDLFIATQATHTGDLPRTLDGERGGDALRTLEYWRVSRNCYEAYKKAGNSEEQVQEALAKRSVPVLSPEKYKQQLEWLINEINTNPQAFKKNTPIELKLARLNAEATLKKVDAQLKKETADAGKSQPETQTGKTSADKPADNKSAVSSTPEAEPLRFQDLWGNEITPAKSEAQSPIKLTEKETSWLDDVRQRFGDNASPVRMPDGSVEVQVEKGRFKTTSTLKPDGTTVVQQDIRNSQPPNMRHIRTDYANGNWHESSQTIRSDGTPTGTPMERSGTRAREQAAPEENKTPPKDTQSDRVARPGQEAPDSGQPREVSARPNPRDMASLTKAYGDVVSDTTGKDDVRTMAFKDGTVVQRSDDKITTYRMDGSKVIEEVDNPGSLQIVYSNAERAAQIKHYQEIAREKGMPFHMPENMSAGWKIHLNVPADQNNPQTKAVVEYLEREHISFKVGQGGADGKGMTIYCGPKDEMEMVAKELSNASRYHIPEQTDGNVLGGNANITGNIWARFDGVREFVKTKPGEFGYKYLQYGPEGVSLLNSDDGERYGDLDWERNKAIENGASPEQLAQLKADQDAWLKAAAERARRELAKDWGAYFTGTD